MDKQGRADAFFSWTKSDGPDASSGLDDPSAGRDDPAAGSLAAASNTPARLRLLADDSDQDLPPEDASRPLSPVGGGAPAKGARAIDRLSLLDAPDDAGEPESEAPAPELSDTRKRAVAEEADAFFSDPAAPDQPLENSSVSTATEAAASAEADADRAERPVGGAKAHAQPTWEQQKRYERLTALVDGSPDAVDPRIRLATVCQEMGKVQEAVKHYRHALRFDTDNAFVRARLAELGDHGGVSGLMTGGPSFLDQLRDALRYPVSNARGRALLVAGGLMTGACAAAVEFQPWIGWLPIVAVGAALLILQHQVVKTSIRGSRELPDWPEAFEAQTALTNLGGAVAAAFALPALLLLTLAQTLPGGIVDALGSPEQPSDYPMYLDRLTQSFVEVDRMPQDKAREAARRELLAVGVPEPGQAGFDDTGSMPILLLALAAILGVFGAAYYPMAVLIATQLESPRQALNYPFGVKQALAAPVEYARLALASVGAFVGGGAGVVFGGGLVAKAVSLPIVGALAGGMLGGVIGVHLFLALSCLAGRVYRNMEGDLGWFRRGGREGGRA